MICHAQGGYSDIFMHTYARVVLFGFNIFLGFQKNYVFWYKDFVDIFWVITKLDYI